MNDTIYRQAAIDALGEEPEVWTGNDDYAQGLNNQWHYDVNAIKALPSAQPEQTDCEYCHEDSDGYVRPIEKNSHVWLVRRGRIMKLHVSFKGKYRECDILFCPMCGRRLTDERLNQQTGGD